MVSSQPRRSVWSARAAEAVLLVVVSYVPFLVSSPGRVTADSKQALYVDPDRFLTGAAYMWDPSFGGGTVPHQHIGYLWPMGPWFWLFDNLGVPTWVAQRLWLGTLTLVAALGARWLLRSLGASRSTALAGALVYALSPYQLAFTARASVLLLPWAGLPVLVELTRRALWHGRWRHPALFALVVVTVAGVNATSLVLVGIGPALVVAWWGLQGREAALTSIATTLRIGVLSLFVSAWWLAGLRIQGAYGLPVLDVTENLSDVARWSSPGDVLRGLGNWFFAGQDQLGYSVDQAEAFLERRWAIALSLVVPCLAMAAAVLLTGRLRLLAVTSIVVATVVGVGAWPYQQPSWFGRLFQLFAQETSVGLAFRNSHRIVPLLLLGIIVLLALAIERLPRVSYRQAGAALVGAAALAAMAPVASTGMLSRNLDRPEELPRAWLEAASHLQARAHDPMGNPYRVLEVPGSPFAAYRWGNTVEPVTPLLIDRPFLAREVLPYGSIATANLLDAFDRRMQEGVMEPHAVAPISRLLSASDVVVRGDLQHERFRTPEPGDLWESLTGPPPAGIGGVETFGAPSANEPDRRLAPVSERDLHFASLVGATPRRSGEPIAPVGILAVETAPPVLQVLPTSGVVLLAGDGDGLVDAAAAGLIDGRTPVLYADALEDRVLDAAIDAGGHVVLTDSNRRRIQTWFYAIRDTRGPTERAGETLTEPTGYDVRLDLFPHAGDEARTVVEHIGGQVSASMTGGASRPEDRAVAAFDADPNTAWRIGGADPRGHRLSVVLDEPVAVGQVTIVQPQDGPRDRVVEQVRLHFDSTEPVEAELDVRSLDPEGQVISFPVRTVERFEIEITAVSDPGFDPERANAVGFAEVVIGNLAISETVVLPRSTLDRLANTGGSFGLDVVMTRLRYDPFDRGRTDTERRLDRTLELTEARAFDLSGTARLNPRGPDEALDDLLGGPTDRSARASSRLVGDLSARASAAIDGDHTTAWTAAFGEQVGQWLEVNLAEPQRIEQVVVSVVVDELHSTPTRLRVELDGVPMPSHQLPEPPTPGPPGSTFEIEIPVEPRVVSQVRVVIDEIDRRSAPPGEPAVMATLPVAVTELEVVGPNPVVTRTPDIDTGCRDDLLLVDDQPLAIRITGPVDAARSGLTIEPCAELGMLDVGRHRLVTAPGHESGIDIDRLLLSSGPDRAGTAATVRGAGSDGARLSSVTADRTAWSAEIDSDGTPFWLVLGQSDNPGWSATIEGGSVDAATVVNGYANGWLVRPDGPGLLAAELTWTPQRLVWWAMAVTVLTVGLCLGFVLGSTPAPAVTGRPIEPGDAARWPHRQSAARSGGHVALVGGVLITAIGVAFISRPWLGAVAGLVVLVRALLPLSCYGFAVAAPMALVASYAIDQPELAWLALAIVVAATVGAETRAGWTGLRGHQEEDARSPRVREARTPRPTALGTANGPRPDPES